METAAGHDLDEPALELAQAVHTRDAGQPVLRRRGAAPPRRVGAIVQRDGRWTSDRTLEEVGIPEGIREVVGRRLSRLSDAANDALAGRRGDRPGVRPRPSIEARRRAVAATSCSTRSTRPTQPACSARCRAPSAATRSPTRWCARRSTRSSPPTAGCACTGRSARPSRPARAPTSTPISTSSPTTSAKGRSPATRTRRSTSAAAPATEATTSSPSRPRPATTTAPSALELFDRPDPELRCDLLLALATALRNAGDPRRRATVFAAAEVARALGDATRLARAALILARLASDRAPGSSTRRSLALYEEALASVPDEPSPLGPGCCRPIAVELQWGPDRSAAAARDRGAGDGPGPRGRAHPQRRPGRGLGGARRPRPLAEAGSSSSRRRSRPPSGRRSRGVCCPSSSIGPLAAVGEVAAARSHLTRPSASPIGSACPGSAGHLILQAMFAALAGDLDRAERARWRPSPSVRPQTCPSRRCWAPRGALSSPSATARAGSAS